MPEFTADLLLRLLAGFLLGSIPFAVLCMIGSGVDIRTVGSGNPGFNNVLRVNKIRAIFCLIGDLGKGAVAILLLRLNDPMAVAWLLGFAVMMGHCYSPFLKFNGGKGVATSCGVMLVLYPWLAVLCIISYVLLRAIGKKRKWREEGALSSLLSWALFTALVLAAQGPDMAAFALMMFLIVAWRHRDNIQRLGGTGLAT